MEGSILSAWAGCIDLVLQEPLINLVEAESAAEALILTEWKTVRKDAEQDSKAKEARLQASLYASGVLGGTELRQYRYLVLVSKDWLRETPDIQEGDTEYRHVNIAVDPQSPSKAAQTNEQYNGIKRCIESLLCLPGEG